MEYFTTLPLAVYLGAFCGTLLYLLKTPTKLSYKEKVAYSVITFYLGISPFNRTVEGFVDFLMHEVGDYRGISIDFASLIASFLGLYLLDYISDKFKKLSELSLIKSRTDEK